MTSRVKFDRQSLEVTAVDSPRNRLLCTRQSLSLIVTCTGTVTRTRPLALVALLAAV